MMTRLDYVCNMLAWMLAYILFVYQFVLKKQNGLFCESAPFVLKEQSPDINAQMGHCFSKALASV